MVETFTINPRNLLFAAKTKYKKKTAGISKE